MGNYTLIDDEVLAFEVIPGADGYGKDMLQFTWEVIDYEADIVKVKIEFADPLYVSQGMQKDYMTVKVLEPLFFRSAYAYDLTKDRLEGGKVKIPQQNLGLGDLKGAKNAATVISVTTVLLSMTMSAILNYVWGMINTMQLIFHLPIIRVVSPQNVTAVFQMVLDQLNMKFIPEMMLF